MTSPPLASAERYWWAAAFGLAAMIAVPLFLADFPPIYDYLNHLARMHVLIRLHDDPILAAMYEIRWAVIPNLAIDVVVPPLSHVVRLDVAGRIFLGMALLFPVAGVVAAHRAAFGGRSYWPLAAAMVAYNSLFFWGFVNFLVGLGLALFGVALWLRPLVGRIGWHLAIVSVLALVLFVCHAQALGLFGLTVGCIELTGLWHARRDHRVTLGAVTCRLFIGAIPFMLPALLFLFAAPLGDALTAKPVPQAIREYLWAVENSYRDGKLSGLGAPVSSYSPLLDGVALAVCGLLFLTQIRRFGCRVQPGLLLAAALLFLAYPVVPSVWLTAANVDSRLPVFAALLIFAGVAPKGVAAPAIRLGAMLFVALLAVRTGVVAYAWADSTSGTKACRQVMQKIEPGARVIVVSGAEALRPLSLERRVLYNYHPIDLAPLLTIDRDAFWPAALYTSKTLQITRVRPAYLPLSIAQGDFPPDTALTQPSAFHIGLNPYVLKWRSLFDYVLVWRPGGTVAERAAWLADSLKPLDTAGICALYAVRK